MTDTDSGTQEHERQPAETRRGLRVNPTVFGVSAAVIIVLVLFGAFFTGTAEAIFPEVQAVAVDFGGWWLALSVVFFLIFVLFVGFSRFGRIRLGADDERPEFSNWAWFTMLFSAGMGIGLVFFAVAEPIYYMTDTEGFPLPVHSPEQLEVLDEVTGGTPAEELSAGDQALVREAAQNSMVYTFFHWGLHAWAIYIVMGLALAYMAFRRGKPLTVRYALQPLLGDRVEGGLGNLIDILAVFGTMFGIATSLGLGVSQVNAGLDQLGVLPVGTAQSVLLIAIITGIATISVVSGLDKGIKYLSMTNIAFAGVLMIFVFLAAPSTLGLLNATVENTGRYLQNIIQISFDTDALGDGEFQGGWTLFYWAWWISWSPFVGMFIARISRGRTIREFVLGVMFVPTAVTILWLTVFGNAALDFHLGGLTGIADAAGEDEAMATFALLNELNVPALVNTLAVALTVLIVTLFFVTSSDSGSLVIDILTADGDLDPPKAQRVFWAVSEGAVAAVLLVAGGLSALQAASISTGLPFSIVLVAIVFSLLVAFRRDPGAVRPRRRGMGRAGDDVDPVLGSVADDSEDPQAVTGAQSSRSTEE